MKWLALILLLAIPCAAQAEQSPSGAALALPLVVPGFEEPKPVAPQMDFKPAEPPAAIVADCAVSNDQLPPEFLKLMDRLDAPVTSTATGLPPVVEQLAPAVAQTQRRRTSRDIEILTGTGNNNREPRVGQTRENGVTVYRGHVPAQRR